MKRKKGNYLVNGGWVHKLPSTALHIIIRQLANTVKHWQTNTAEFYESRFPPGRDEILVICGG